MINFIKKPPTRSEEVRCNERSAAPTGPALYLIYLISPFPPFPPPKPVGSKAPQHPLGGPPLEKGFAL